MEPTDNLPAIPKKENLLYLRNANTNTYDIIDLSTGKQVATEEFQVSSKLYSLAMCDHICDLVRSGKTLSAISRMPDMPSYSRIMAWESVYPEFRTRIQDARRQRAEAFADLALETAMSVTNKDEVPAAKLQVDTLKWRAEKADPENYGNKKDEGPKGTNINITLHTGVLDSPAPRDIIVDDYGNFKGFDGDVIEETSFIETEVDIELNRDRFTETEDGERQEEISV